jgi:hypothetical protein
MHWNVGKVKITKVVELETVGSTHFILPLATNEEIRKLPWLIPHFANEEGRLKMSIHSLLVETPSRRIIVDTGLGNDKQGRNVPTWNNRKDPFLDKLTAAGFPPDSIDTVLCTHLHADHVGWNTRLEDGRWVPTFPNARYVVQKGELEFARSDNERIRASYLSDNFEPVVAAFYKNGDYSDYTYRYIHGPSGEILGAWVPYWVVMKQFQVLQLHHLAPPRLAQVHERARVVLGRDDRDLEVGLLDRLDLLGQR